MSIDLEETANFTDNQKQQFVEAVTATSSRLVALLAASTRSQGTELALRDIQANWNLPVERRWTELGAWKTISRHTDQVLANTASAVKKAQRLRKQAELDQKSVPTVTLLELFETTQQAVASE